MTNLIKGSTNQFAGAAITGIAFGFVIATSKEIKFTTTKKVLMGIAVLGVILAGIGTFSPSNQQITPTTTPAKSGYLNI